MNTQFCVLMVDNLSYPECAESAVMLGIYTSRGLAETEVDRFWEKTEKKFRAFIYQMEIDKSVCVAIWSRGYRRVPRERKPIDDVFGIKEPTKLEREPNWEKTFNGTS